MVLALKKYIQGFLLLGVFTLLLGFVYPFSIYLINQFCFKNKANNSLFMVQGVVRGSILIGQSFIDPKYFWGRPNSEEKAQRLEHDKLLNKISISPDWFSVSASDLDPHISYQSVMIQLERVSNQTGRYRGILEDYIALAAEPRQFGFMGQPRINVLKLNLLIYHNQ